MFRRDRMTNDTERERRSNGIREKGPAAGSRARCGRRGKYGGKKKLFCMSGRRHGFYRIGLERFVSSHCSIGMCAGQTMSRQIQRRSNGAYHETDACRMSLQWLINNNGRNRAAQALTITITNIFEKSFHSLAFSSHGPTYADHVSHTQHFHFRRASTIRLDDVRECVRNLMRIK